MDIMIIAGVVVTLIGLAGLVYCMVKAYKAKKAGLVGDDLTAHLKKLVVVNLLSFLFSAIGLMLVVFGIILAG